MGNVKSVIPQSCLDFSPRYIIRIKLILSIKFQKYNEENDSQLSKIKENF